MRQTGISILLLFLCITNLYAIPPIGIPENSFLNTYSYSFPQGESILDRADAAFARQNFREAIRNYKSALKTERAPSATVLKKIALGHAALNHPRESVDYLEQALMAEFNTKILADSGFDPIRGSQAFLALEKKYLPKPSIWSFMYLYVALIGFYIAIVINFNRKIDRIAKILISSFIFIHSVFILNICFNITNYQYEYPHSYLMSTAFSFLYGPLLYFYFKRITKQYVFKKRDLLHLLPTAVFLLYIVPIYAMSAEDKLALMFQRVADGYRSSDSAYLITIVCLKLTSLIVYGYFIRRLYFAARSNKDLSKTNQIWQRNIYGIHFLYLVTYAVYGILISLQVSSGIFYHSQIVCMSLMVMFLGFSANVQPSVFSGLFSFENQLFFKYEKSGLTESLSKELKENLLRLFDIEKIYKENDLSLESLAERLNTTRHNASQVINEHFQMNFHELVNRYRIQEAKHILDTDYKKSLHIIDVAYEVGFNNKVTFNKAFKKDTQLTPSEYQRVSVQA